MAANRKLQGEIDRTLKKVQRGYRERRCIQMVALLLSLVLPAHGLFATAPRSPLVSQRAAPTQMLDIGTAATVLPPLGGQEIAEAGIGLGITAAAVVRTVKKRASSAAAGVAAAATAAANAPKAELSIGELLREYGVIALLFHFTVWCSTCAAAFSALTIAGVGDVTAISWLPDSLREAGEGAGAAGTLAIMLGLVEITGPARLALTVAVTPAVSERAREYEAVRVLETRVQNLVGRVAQSLPQRGA